MTTEPFIPHADSIQTAWVLMCQQSRISTQPPAEELEAEFDRFLARVRRDAAREALDGLINECRTEHEEAATNNRVGGMVLELHAQQVAMNYRDTHYPEETP